MDENKELLEYIYQNIDMGIKALNNLINTINGKDNKIKKIIEGEIKGYENYLKECKKIMKKYKIEPKSKGIMADIGNFLGTKMEMMKDNSDARIADMLTKGFTMGVVDITKRIDNYKGDADKDILNLAKKLLKFSQENIDFLKPYL